MIHVMQLMATSWVAVNLFLVFTALESVSPHKAVLPAKIKTIEEIKKVGFSDTEIPWLETVLRCTAVGFPFPSITWLRNGQHFPTFGDSNTWSVLKNLSGLLDNTVMTIHKPGSSTHTSEAQSVLKVWRGAKLGRDQDTYTCRATNALGSDEKQTTFERIDNKFLFIKRAPLLIFRIAFGTPITIDCSTTDPNATTSLWFAKGGTGHHEFEFKSNATQHGHNFTVSSPTREDLGVYKCKAFGGRGEVIQWPNDYGKFLAPLALNPRCAVKVQMCKNFKKAPFDGERYV